MSKSLLKTIMGAGMKGLMVSFGKTSCPPPVIMTRVIVSPAKDQSIGAFADFRDVPEKQVVMLIERLIEDVTSRQ